MRAARRAGLAGGRGRRYGNPSFGNKVPCAPARRVKPSTQHPAGRQRGAASPAALKAGLDGRAMCNVVPRDLQLFFFSFSLEIESEFFHMVLDFLRQQHDLNA